MDEEEDVKPSAATFRQREADMRAEAEAATLPGQKAKFTAAAERWRQLAELAENPPRLPPKD